MMKTQKFYSDNMQDALALARETLGPDCFVISNRRLGEGVELEVGVNSELEIKPVIPVKIPEETQPLKTISDLSQKEEINDELTFLRTVFKEHIAQLVAKNEASYTATQAMIVKKLERFGFADSIVKTVVDSLEHYPSFKNAWGLALRLLENKIKVTEHDLLLEGGLFRIAGATGSGKTTAIAKLANRYVKQFGTANLGIITCDTNRAGAQEQLMLYGRALGVPVYVAKDNARLSETLDRLSDKHLVLIDTAGTNQRDRRMLAEQSQLFENHYDVKTYVTLPATFQSDVLNEIIDAFTHSKIDGCLLTKVDEAYAMAPVLNQVILRQLPVAYVSDGQDISVNIFRADARRLIKLATEITSHATATIS